MSDDDFERFLERTARGYNAPPPTPRDAIWARIEAERSAGSRGAPLRSAPRHRWLAVGAAIAAMLLVGIAIGYVWRGTTDSRLVAERTSGMPDSAARRLAEAGSESANAPDSGFHLEGRDLAGAYPAMDSGEDAATSAEDVATSADATGRERVRDAARGERRLATLPPDSRDVRRGSPESLPRAVPRSGGMAANRQSAAYAALTAEHLGRVEMLLTSYRAESERGQVDPQIASWAGDLLGTTRLLLDSPGASDPRVRRLLGDLEMVLTQITQLGAEQGSRKDELQLIDQSLRSHDVMTRIRGATPAGAGALPIGT